MFEFTEVLSPQVDSCKDDSRCLSDNPLHNNDTLRLLVHTKVKHARQNVSKEKRRDETI